MSAIPGAGFADPTRDSQQAFRAILDALAHPGSGYALPVPQSSPEGLGDGVAGVLLTVLDEDTSVWLHDDRAEVSVYLDFHTGARRASVPGEAGFVVTAAAGLPHLDELARGSLEAPHESATVVLDARSGTGASVFTAQGPGIDGTTTIEAPWAPEDFLDQWQRNAAGFPLGVDMIIVTDTTVTALPRTTRLRAPDSNPKV